MPDEENEAAVRRQGAAMPSLDLETSLRSKRALGHLLRVHGPPTPRGKQIADGYVRLVEKAILEYRASRERLIAFLREGFADDYFRAQDHFESSTNALHRAIAYLDRLRLLNFRQADGAPFIPRPRDLEVLSAPVKDRVRALRDRAEHLDEDILNGTIAARADVGIHLGWESATLGGAELRYEDVARWIGQLHAFALLLSRVQIVVSDPTNSPTGDDVGDR